MQEHEKGDDAAGGDGDAISPSGRQLSDRDVQKLILVTPSRSKEGRGRTPHGDEEAAVINDGLSFLSREIGGKDVSRQPCLFCS